MGPNSFQWCPVTGQGATGTNWSTGSSIWTWGRPASLWGWRSTGTGCPGRLWSLLLWRYARPAWTRSYAACAAWPCFGRGVGLDDPQRFLPTPTILWFCDSVSFCIAVHSIINSTTRIIFEFYLSDVTSIFSPSNTSKIEPFLTVCIIINFTKLISFYFWLWQYLLLWSS